MNDTSIACFLSVARTGSFTVSAQDLSSTQQALSRNIQSLEDELGFSLLDRSGRTITLTWEGERFFSWCIDSDRQIALTAAAAQRLMGDGANTLRLGWCEWTGCPAEMESGLRAFTDIYPTCKLDVRQGTADEIQAFLLEDDLDLAILPEYYTHNMSNIIVSEPFMELPLYAVAGDLLSFAGEVPTPTELTPAKQLAAHFGNNAGLDMQKHMDYLCSAIGIYPEHLEVMPNVVSAYAELACGPCYMISPMTSRAVRRGDLHFYPLEVSMPLVFVRAHENATAWASLFETFIRHRRTEP